MKFKMNKKGNSGIYIKPENRGKFTATKKATGKTTEELTHSKNPITKKRAIFAQNAAKWKHEDGSKGVKSFPDLNKDGKISRADVLVGRGVIPAKKMQMGTKATKDSTNYFKGQEKNFRQLAKSEKGDSEVSKFNKRFFENEAGKAVSSQVRQSHKGSPGYDKNGNPLDKKMCGSKGMKYQAGSKSMKATSDSTNYFRKKIVEESLKQPRGKFSSFSEESAKINRKINKLGEDLDRQELKGKPGYDANGYPLKKGVKKSSGASGDFANGTKSIKFKKKEMIKRADGSYSQRGLWDNIRANKGSGKKPTPEMLKQEKKIKAEGLKKKIVPDSVDNGIKKYDMGKYILLIGNDATEVFKYYNVTEMHGLNVKDAQAEEVDKTKGNGVYIYGLTNYDPRDKKLTAKTPYKPFLFLNAGTFNKYSSSEQITAIMHETMHMSILLNNWNIKDKEEEAIGSAEEEANRIISTLSKN